MFNCKILSDLNIKIQSNRNTTILNIVTDNFYIDFWFKVDNWFPIMSYDEIVNYPMFILLLMPSAVFNITSIHVMHMALYVSHKY
jgi:hypothetical protein